MRRNDQNKQALIAARRDGATLREAAARIGVHAATVCRWQNSDPKFAAEFRTAAVTARRHQLRLSGGPRPRVPWHSQCPLCKARVVVRTAANRVRFWRCGRWPWCRWASWRPRAPRNCRKCGQPCFWSHSRKSISCGACGMRISTHLPPP